METLPQDGKAEEYSRDPALSYFTSSLEIACKESLWWVPAGQPSLDWDSSVRVPLRLTSKNWHVFSSEILAGWRYFSCHPWSFKSRTHYIFPVAGP